MWVAWTGALRQQTVRPSRVIVVDSGSNDKTLEISSNEGFEITSINKDRFNHGGTRQFALSKLRDEAIVIYMTQDAILADKESLAYLLKPFSDDRVAAVCGRQLPRQVAGPIEAHARLFNYRGTSTATSAKDIGRLGLRAAFLSNSFAAYRLSALLEVGGFPDDVIFGEDMYVATKLLMMDYKIAYAARAVVYHSHDYTMLHEFRRYFDMGVFHAREPWIRDELGKAEGEGFRFVVSELGYLSSHAPWRVPEAALRSILRYLGFRLGRLEKHIPPKLKRNMAMNRGYFK